MTTQFNANGRAAEKVQNLERAQQWRETTGTLQLRYWEGRRARTAAFFNGIERRRERESAMN